jgi:hypothetical protein
METKPTNIKVYHSCPDIKLTRVDELTMDLRPVDKTNDMDLYTDNCEAISVNYFEEWKDVLELLPDHTQPFTIQHVSANNYSLHISKELMTKLVSETGLKVELDLPTRYFHFSLTISGSSNGNPFKYTSLFIEECTGYLTHTNTMKIVDKFLVDINELGASDVNYAINFLNEITFQDYLQIIMEL